ncbi:hypothetical protein J7E93_15810 [Streptomyces sp. ISL-36]|uniref:hypothetical protein n=1 Tax=Streptomyces sp. ISL-36 TaxID=2819182 RepID=UPI001BEC1408|nr:hypothetical protein [Streptomyces sp. ISL-36]MBT2441554.1 hypothetical protein [Streptomyces sp. ISL-36]
MKKSLAVAGATCAALLLGTTTATAQAATAAAPAPPAAAPMAAAAACNLAVYTPWKENISSSGVNDHARSKYWTVNNCSGWYFTATLQYHRWDGWNRVAGTDWVGNRSTSYLQWRCQGKGTFTYRTKGSARGGSPARVGWSTSGERRFSC